MFMRYLGGGVGHHTQQYSGADTEAANGMDIGEDDGGNEDGDEDPPLEGWGSDEDDEDEEMDEDEGEEEDSGVDEDQDFGPEDGENEHGRQDDYDYF